MATGVAVRQQLSPRARQMRAEGLKYREIAERLGLAKSTVAEWCKDPDRVKHAERRRRYGGQCGICGGPTDGSRGPVHPAATCAECLYWTEDAVIAAMQEWAAEHGEPPRSDDWRVALDGYPSARVAVIRRVGWNNLLLKAGFGLRQDKRPETQAEIERLISEGLSVREVAERLAHLGVTVRSIYFRLHSRGLTVTALREAA